MPRIPRPGPKPPGPGRRLLRAACSTCPNQAAEMGRPSVPPSRTRPQEAAAPPGKCSGSDGRRRLRLGKYFDPGTDVPAAQRWTGGRPPLRGQTPAIRPRGRRHGDSSVPGQPRSRPSHGQLAATRGLRKAVSGEFGRGSRETRRGCRSLRLKRPGKPTAAGSKSAPGACRSRPRRAPWQPRNPRDPCKCGSCRPTSR